MCHDHGCPFVDTAEYKAALDRYFQFALGTDMGTDPLLDYHTRLRADLTAYEASHPEVVGRA